MVPLSFPSSVFPRMPLPHEMSSVSIQDPIFVDRDRERFVAVSSKEQQL